MIDDVGIAEETDLEEQRAFLIRSLEDLEEERAAGNIDDDTYALLHGDYTARCAAVLRAIEGEPVEMPAGPPPVSTGRRALVVGGLVVFAIAAAVTLAITIAPRQPGQTVTGGVTSDTGAKALSALKQAVHDHPNDYSARVEYARQLLATDRVTALQQYNAAATLSPSEPEPPTYIGWILALASAQVTDAKDRVALLERSLSEIARAHQLDAKYPDAYVFEGLVRSRFAGDPAGAVGPLKEYLKLAPDGPEASDVKAALATAEKQAKAPPTTPTS